MHIMGYEKKHWRFMKKIGISVKNHFLSDSYVPMFKKYDYVKYLDIEDDNDLEKLAEYIALQVHSFYIYNKNIRNEENFEKAYGLIIDFDNKHGHTDSTIEEFTSSSFAQKHNWVLYTSKSHINDLQDCYHVFLPFTDPITSVRGLKAAYAAIFDELDECGLSCDTQVHDGARLIFPSLKLYGDDEIYIDSNFCGDYYDFVEPSTYGASVTIDAPLLVVPSIKDYDGGTTEPNLYLDEFNKMSKKAQYRYMKSMATFVNAKNRASGFTLLGYNAWIAIGYSFHQAFGVTNGLKLFKTLSRGCSTDTTASIERQFGYLNNDMYTADDNMDILIKISTKHGFKHSMYFKYYYMSRHRYGATESKAHYRAMKHRLRKTYGLDGYSMNEIKIYNYTDKKHTRCFLMEVSRDGEIHKHITVRLGEMMDIMSKILRVHRDFITTSVTKGIIRRFINRNGVYNLLAYARNKIIEGTDNSFIRVEDVNSVMRDIREYAPTTVHEMFSNKNMQKYLTEVGFLLEKKKKRFGSKSYMAFKVDLTKSFSRAFAFIKEESNKFINNYVFSVIENRISTPSMVVMQC